LTAHHRSHTRRSAGLACRWCVTRQRAWLREITDLYATLHQVIAAGSIPDDTADHGKPKKQPASPAPMRLDAWAMLYDTRRLRPGARIEGTDQWRGVDYRIDLPDVPAVLEAWAGRLYDDMYSNEPQTMNTLTAAAAFLTAQAEPAAHLPWLDEYDAELGWCRTALRRVHGISAQQPVGRCPTLNGHGETCGGPLWPSLDGMQVHCGYCSRIFDERFLSHLGGMISAS